MCLAFWYYMEDLSPLVIFSIIISYWRKSTPCFWQILSAQGILFGRKRIMCLNNWDFVYSSTNYKWKRTTGSKSTIQYEFKMTHEKQNVKWNISNETFVDNCDILSMKWETDNCLVTSKDNVIDHHILIIFLLAYNEGETWPLDCTINQPCDSPQQNISSKYRDIYNLNLP
jgi:hypothetical protein